MRHAAIEGAANHRAAGLEDICAAKVLPQAQRDRRQHDARRPHRRNNAPSYLFASGT